MVNKLAKAVKNLIINDRIKFFTVTFEHINDCDFLDLLYAVGGYVIWDSKSKKRPTYIGEGDIAARLVKHKGRFSYPINCYVAIFEGTYNQVKAKSEIVEAILLEVGYQIDQAPNHNKILGKWHGIDKILSGNKKLKVVFKGFDPLKHPDEQKSFKMLLKRKVEIFNGEDGQLEFEHNW